jgi:hypothetical protein
MAFLPKHNIKVRAISGDNPPVQPSVDPPTGSVPKSPIPEGIEMHAQTLIHHAGSPEKTKDAMDGAAERETIHDYREDHFGQRFGFASRPELLAASTPLTAANGTPWWKTAIEECPHRLHNSKVEDMPIRKLLKLAHLTVEIRGLQQCI